jgi:hypothetical protein
LILTRQFSHHRHEKERSKRIKFAFVIAFIFDSLQMSVQTGGVESKRTGGDQGLAQKN